MTAEVVIANAGAIALAADSAVTIGDQKIYNSALKLFSLSKVAPVGTMVYGNAGLLGVPWETLIKSYRKKIGSNTFNTLEEYANDFIKCLNGRTDLFPVESQQRWLSGNVIGYFTLIRNEFFNELHPILKEKGQVTSEETTKALLGIVNKHHALLKDLPFATGITKSFEEKIRTKYMAEFREIKELIFEKAKISSSTTAKLYDIATFIHTRQKFSNNVSGLVVAGYGESEIYPSVVTFDVEGVVANKLKYRINEGKSGKINGGNECRIVAFAQEDMVATFMQGINPQVLHFLKSYLDGVFKRLPEILDDSKNSPEDKRLFKSSAAGLLSEFLEKLGDHLRDEQSYPVLRMVTVLPKDELAAMAEALVNLTAFKRRITESMETVGGPIDVAVISKGDGLIWVKRKHYFRPELNQHFFANYFRGLVHEK